MPTTFAASVALNRRIADARTWQEVIEITRAANPKSINSVCAATALHRVAKLGGGSSQGRRGADLAQIIALIESKVEEFEARHISNIMWSFAKLKLRLEPDLWEALCGKAERSAGSFNPQDFANTLWSFATLGVSPSPSLLASLSNAAERSAGSFKAQEVANTLWSFETFTTQNVFWKRVYPRAQILSEYLISHCDSPAFP